MTISKHKQYIYTPSIFRFLAVKLYWFRHSGSFCSHKYRRRHEIFTMWTSEAFKGLTAEKIQSFYFLFPPMKCYYGGGEEMQGSNSCDSKTCNTEHPLTWTWVWAWIWRTLKEISSPPQEASKCNLLMGGGTVAGELQPNESRYRGK